MLEQIETNRIFSLNIDFKDPLQNKLFSMVKNPIEHFLAFPRLNRAYAQIADMKDNRPFPDKVLDLLKISYEIADEDMSRLQAATGPVIVVSNHPFGGIEGVVLASALGSLRCDVKFMANSLLNCIPDMRDMLIGVNPFNQDTTARENFRPLRECIQWVRNGGMLVIFPAGEVSHFDMQKGAITDPAWSPTIARIIRKTGAQVLPLFFQGTNSAAFHMAGMVHPLLRTALLPNELLNKNRRTIQMRVGDLIPNEKLEELDQDTTMMEYLRTRTYILEHRASKPAHQNVTTIQPKKMSRPIIPPQRPIVLADEISRLLPSQTLVESGESVVIQATSDQIPNVLLEIGRLREITFRAVGEGTGNAVDLDGFDQTYVHLFIWNRKNQEVVGAYRLGLTDELVRKQGIRGLYTSTLFRYDREFLNRLGPALELGRSFIRSEYQRSYAPLLLLWKGICRYMIDNPQYRIVFGPVSITNEYQALSKELIVRFLKMTRFRDDMAGLIRARRPVKTKSVKSWDIDAAVRSAKDDIEDISELISSIESDHKGIPILLKQYLKLGGQILGFNVDPAFGNVLDGLIMVDLTRTQPRMLERFLGKDGTRQFLAYHQAIRSEGYAYSA
jgi:putative hemolysin